MHVLGTFLTFNSLMYLLYPAQIKQDAILKFSNSTRTLIMPLVFIPDTNGVGGHLPGLDVHTQNPAGDNKQHELEYNKPVGNTGLVL